MRYDEDILKKLASGEISVDSALKLLSYEDTGYAKIDHSRPKRTGYPEIIYGEGKSAEQAVGIFSKMAVTGVPVICTRTDAAKAQAIMNAVPGAAYHPVSRIVYANADFSRQEGLVAVATGGTADMAVGEEAALVLELFGSKVERLYDVGVAGVHRLLAQQNILNRVNCVIVAAGMEGALASVVSGLVKVPVIAVPTSAGYGANFGGLAALIGMLCSCAPGISVVNIDNGFGAAYQADMINKLTVGRA